MKLSDYVIGFLSAQGVGHIFGLTGGAVVHFFDSADRDPTLRPVFTHHEQAAAFAAQAYARVKNDLGAAFVTTGPGGTNALTGLCAAWLDSIPCVFVSGQTRLAHTTRGKAIRQLGVQQLDIVNLVKPLTKYAVMLEDASQIRYELEKAVHIARTGRPGPVWLDIPLDFQWASITPDALPSFVSDDPPAVRATTEQIQHCSRLIAAAKRPLLLVGHGVRLGRAEKEVGRFLQATQMPFVSSWNSTDLYSNDSDLYLGRPGIFGQRGANLAVQNCDLLLSIGSHLGIPLTGTMFKAFAREANVVMVDIDQTELDNANVHVELPIRADAKAFMADLCASETTGALDIGEWRNACANYKSHFDRVPPEWRHEEGLVNQYVFIDQLSDALTDTDVVVVDGGGTINQVTFQAFRAKHGQRLLISGGLCSMGSGLPESVGACFASGKHRTVCLCGDGSLQLNIQELQTISHHKLPVKVFVINNDGYLSIRHTQQGFLESNFVGSGKTGGLSLPDSTKVAAAYGIPAITISNHRELGERLPAFLDAPGPGLCEIVVDHNSQVSPRQGFLAKPDGTFSPQPLENMAPFLDEAEFCRNMFIPRWEN